MASLETKKKSATAASSISVGTGLVLFGVWLFAAGVTITMLVIAFVANDYGLVQKFEEHFWAAVLIFLIFAAPSLMASGLTKLILGYEDD